MTDGAAEHHEDLFVNHPGASGHSAKNPMRTITVQLAAKCFRQVTAGSKWERCRLPCVFRHSFISSWRIEGIDQRLIDDGSPYD